MDSEQLPDRCAADGISPAAIDAMVLAASTLAHDDGHTACYYAGLLRAALPHLIDEAAERIFASGILDEIAAAELDGKLAGRDAMQDAVAVARLALGTDEEGRTDA